MKNLTRPPNTKAWQANLLESYLEPLDHSGRISQANTATKWSSGTVLGVHHLDPFRFLGLVAVVVHRAPVASGFLLVVAT